MVQWLGSYAFTVVAGVRFPVAEFFFAKSKNAKGKMGSTGD